VCRETLYYNPSERECNDPRKVPPPLSDYIYMRRVPYYKSVGPPPGVPFRDDDDDDYVENAARAFSFTRHRRTFLSVRAAVCTEKQDDDEREIQL
jgi:hypothetical protein